MDINRQDVQDCPHYSSVHVSGCPHGGFHWAVMYGDCFVSIEKKCCAYCLEGCIGSVVCAI